MSMETSKKAKEISRGAKLYDKERNIINWALKSRLIVIFLQFVSNLVVSDHDANVFLYPKENLTHSNFDNALQTLFGGFIRWDAQYFMHIARYGYSFENTVAFFPLLPITVGYMASLLSYFVHFVNVDSLTIIVFIILNTCIFVMTAVILFRLTLVLKDVTFAYKSSILFCFNPASIFFSAPYTECLFCYLTFKSILNCVNLVIVKNDDTKYLKLKDVFKCIIYISLSTCTRSNGILNIAFFVYFYLKHFFRKLFRMKYKLETVIYIINSSILLGIYVILAIIPFLLVQLYSYNLFCTNFIHGVPTFLVDFADNNQLVLPGSFYKHNQSWCHRKLPLAYSYVQDHYWDVGFMKYYELKQIPNFLLALPVIYIVIENSFNFLNQNKAMLLHLGLFQRRSYEQNKFKNFFHQDFMFPCIVHVFILTVFCMLFIHVQVTTRIIFSASPAVYWFCTQPFVEKCVDRKQMFIKYYFLMYFVLGTVLFCNFLPWT